MIRKTVFVVISHYDAFEQKIECVCATMEDAIKICRRLNKRYATPAIINKQYDFDFPDNYDWLGDEQYYDWTEYLVTDADYYKLTHPFIPNTEGD